MYVRPLIVIWIGFAKCTSLWSSWSYFPLTGNVKIFFKRNYIYIRFRSDLFAEISNIVTKVAKFLVRVLHSTTMFQGNISVLYRLHRHRLHSMFKESQFCLPVTRRSRQSYFLIPRTIGTNGWYGSFGECFRVTCVCSGWMCDTTFTRWILTKNGVVNEERVDCPVAEKFLSRRY